MRTVIVFAKIGAAISLAVAAMSCAGVKCSLKADSMAQPVSFTPCVYGRTGKIVRTSEQDVLKHFKIKKRLWAMLWRTVNLTQNNWDLSNELAGEISSVKGDAVVNLTVRSISGWWWYASSNIPILPDFLTIVVEGDVVRMPPEARAQ